MIIRAKTSCRPAVCAAAAVCAFLGVICGRPVAGETTLSAGTRKARAAVESGITEVRFADLSHVIREASRDPVVFRTRWGTHYHRGGCFYLRQSCFPLQLSEAKALGLAPCSRCVPPR